LTGLISNIRETPISYLCRVENVANGVKFLFG
jgi:hypothetical protein